jgi:hypothetical protein
MESTAVPVNVCTDTEGSRRLRLPEFIDNCRHIKVARLSALRTGQLCRQEIFLVLIYFGG